MSPFVKGCVVFFGWLVVSVAVGHTWARHDIEHCKRMADTPKCHSDRARGR